MRKRILQAFAFLLIFLIPLQIMGAEEDVTAEYVVDESFHLDLILDDSVSEAEIGKVLVRYQNEDGSYFKDMEYKYLEKSHLQASAKFTQADRLGRYQVESIRAFDSQGNQIDAQIKQSKFKTLRFIEKESEEPEKAQEDKEESKEESLGEKEEVEEQDEPEEAEESEEAEKVEEQDKPEESEEALEPEETEETEETEEPEVSEQAKESEDLEKADDVITPSTLKKHKVSKVELKTNQDKKITTGTTVKFQAIAR